MYSGMYALCLSVRAPHLRCPGPHDCIFNFVAVEIFLGVDLLAATAAANLNVEPFQLKCPLH